MVREATRLFNENKGSIDTEKVTATVKEVAAKAEKEGLVDKARSSLSDVMDKPVPVDVPATRPAPGISGGAPTPVAMPIEANAAADTEPGAPAPGNTATAPDAVIGNSSVESIAGAAPTTPRIPDSPGLTPDEIPAPQPLTYDDKGKPTTQIALARVADYDAIKGEFVLSGGPPYIQDGDKFIKTNSEDAQIIMRKNGLYEILGSTNRSTIVIPIEQDEKKPGKKKGGPSDFGGGLGDAFNGLR